MDFRKGIGQGLVTFFGSERGNGLSPGSFHPSDEDLLLGAPESFHPNDEDLSLGTPGSLGRMGAVL